MINVGPTQTGMIQPIFVERLRTIGNWLKINGDAIYESNPWIYQNDTKTPGVWYTAKPNEKAKVDRINVYALILKYPYDADGVNLYALGDKFDNNTTVKLLGYPKNLKVSNIITYLSIIFTMKYV